MDWMNVLEQVFNLIVYPVISIAGIYLTYLISTKIQELKQKTSNEMADKYLDMLDVTISDAVLATTQTYVDSLKKQGKFDAEAQKAAFKLTYDAVMKVLTEDAVKYLTIIVGDLETYVVNKIEADVKLSKNY
jgi:hypothetical protein